MKRLTHLSLFSGIGGLDLAAEWAGFETVGQCEWADYPTKVLEKQWPDVPRWRDIRTLTKESFYERTGLRTVDIISGGFPCQPFSVAGKQKGKGDDRYLWPEMLRVIRELAPRWVIGENVPGILRIAAADVIADLEREGYDVAVFDFEAAAVGAPHRRERIAFVGNAKHNGPLAPAQRGIANENGNHITEGKNKASEFAGAGRRNNNEALADALCDGGQTGITDPQRGEKGHTAEPFDGGETVGNTNESDCGRNDGRWQPERLAERCWWAAEPDVGRVAHGVPNRVDRLKCLGNAVVPQQFYPIFKAIHDIEEETWNTFCH